MRDVTDQVDSEGAEAGGQRRRESSDAVTSAIEAVKGEIARRQKAMEPEILKKQAEAFLTSRRVKQEIAREATNSPVFESVPVAGKGHPKVLRVGGKNNRLNRNTVFTEPARIDNGRGADFGCPDSMHPTEINLRETQYLCGPVNASISVEDSAFSPTTDAKKVAFPSSVEVEWEA